MQTLPSIPMPLEFPEAVLNLWAYVDENECIFRLAGKAYVMDGDDAEKLSLLRQLSSTDFLSSHWQKVPSRFVFNGPDSQQIEGLAHRSVLSDKDGISTLFGSLIEQLAQAIPTQLRSVDGEFEQFRIDLPQDPLMVMTVILEHEDGQLVPMMSEGSAVKRQQAIRPAAN